MATWQPKGRAPERILLYGPSGAGKTNSAMDLLNAVLGGDDGERTAYIIDTDNSYARFLESGRHDNVTVRREWEDGEWIDDWCVDDGRVVLLHAHNWEQTKFALNYAHDRAKRGDWIVLDSATHPWQHIQEWYIERVHGTELPEFLIEARVRQIADKKGADGGASAMLVEWAFVNKEWSKVFLTPFVNARCHMLVTAEAKLVRTDDRGDGKEIKDLYGVVGWKPDSQRRIGANAQTVVFMEKDRGKEPKWLMTTVKDRERDMVTRIEVKDFARQYLFTVAGWRPRKGD